MGVSEVLGLLGGKRLIHCIRTRAMSVVLLETRRFKSHALNSRLHKGGNPQGHGVRLSLSSKYDPRLDKRASKWKSGTKEIIHVTGICIHTCLQGAGRGPATRVPWPLRVSDSAKHSSAEHL